MGATLIHGAATMAASFHDLASICNRSSLPVFKEESHQLPCCDTSYMQQSLKDSCVGTILNTGKIFYILKSIQTERFEASNIHSQQVEEDRMNSSKLTFYPI